VGVWFDIIWILVSADVAEFDGGCDGVWERGVWVSFHECRAAYFECVAGLFCFAADDGDAGAEFGGGAFVCGASAARGVGGVGDGAEGCSDGVVWAADDVGVCGVCAARTDGVVFVDDCFLWDDAAFEIDAGDAAVSFFVAGFLAVGAFAGGGSGQGFADDYFGEVAAVGDGGGD